MAKLTNGVSPDRLDQLVHDLGVRVLLYKSTVCPNMKSLESMDHNINCSVCSNNMIDFCPKETMAIFQQQDLVEQFKSQGTFSMDEVTVTFLAGETLQHYTRVDLLDFPEDFFELVQKQEATNIDRLKYSAVKILGLFVVRNNVKIEFHYGIDFELDVNGDIKWTSANKPNDREIYSVYYQYLPIYRAVKAVHRDRFSQYNVRPDEIKSPKKTIGDKTYVKLPETWILKRDYLLERRDAAEALLKPNTAYDPNQV